MEHEEFTDDVVKIEIDGVLDLHHFSPKEIKFLIPDYLDECLQKNIYEVRIIHGKGRGVLRRTVASILERLPCVVSYRLADQHQANWGATIVSISNKKTDQCNG
jgi:DNA-nicking Smr family endonuclease